MRLLSNRNVRHYWRLGAYFLDIRYTVLLLVRLLLLETCAAVIKERKNKNTVCNMHTSTCMYVCMHACMPPCYVWLSCNFKSHDCPPLPLPLAPCVRPSAWVYAAWPIAVGVRLQRPFICCATMQQSRSISRLLLRLGKGKREGTCSGRSAVLWQCDIQAAT